MLMRRRGEPVMDRLREHLAYAIDATEYFRIHCSNCFGNGGGCNAADVHRADFPAEERYLRAFRIFFFDGPLFLRPVDRSCKIFRRFPADVANTKREEEALKTDALPSFNRLQDVHRLLLLKEGKA